MAVKVQLDNDYVRSLAGKKVGDVLQGRDERGAWEEMAARLDIAHLLDREVQALSGGELQRFAIASTAVWCAQSQGPARGPARALLLSSITRRSPPPLAAAPTSP